MAFTPFQIMTAEQLNTELASSLAGVADRLTSISVPHNTTTVIGGLTELFDNDGNMVGVNDFSVNVAGLWSIDALVSFQLNGTGFRRVSGQINGISGALSGPAVAAAPGIQTRVQFSRRRLLDVNDLVAIEVEHNAGVGVNLTVTLIEFSMHLIAKSP